MKKPTCNLPSYKNFKVSKKDLIKYTINPVFNEIELEEWANIDTLIEKDKKSLDGEHSIKKYKDAFTKISKHLTRYPFVQAYSNKVKQYMETAFVNNEYLNKYEKDKAKEAKTSSKRRLQSQTKINKFRKEDNSISSESSSGTSAASFSTAIPASSDTSAIASSGTYATASSGTSVPASSSIVIPTSSDTPDTASSGTSVPASSDTSGAVPSGTSLPTSSSTVIPTSSDTPDTASSGTSVPASFDTFAAVPSGTSLLASSKTILTPKAISIRNIIHDAAAALHGKYQNGEPLTSSELKTMACGLSCILDTNSDETEGSQRLLFDEGLWKGIYLKYTLKHKLDLPPVPTTIDEQWDLISSLCKNNNDSRTARHLICKLKLSSSTLQQERTLDFLDEIVFQIGSKQFMFDENNSSKISERDFAYQLWLPVLNKLFCINNMARIKIGETVLAGTTFAKSLLYQSSENIVGFKVDIRLILDYKDEEFDLMCGEACHHDANKIKLTNDDSKLIREGKEIQRSLAHIFYYGSNLGYAWTVQVKGTKCYFATIHPTPYHYHVSIPQFEISFPTSYSLMDEKNCNFIGPLLAFRTSIEKLLVEVENRLKRPSLTGSPDRSQQQPPEPTWFTPPRNDNMISRIPLFEAFDSEEMFYYNDPTNTNTDTNNLYDQADQFGFVKIDGQWFNINTKVYWDSDPFANLSL